MLETRQYQIDAIEFLKDSKNKSGKAFLFLPPGYGKSGIIIRYFLDFLKNDEDSKCLLVSPINTIESSWKEEVKKFDTNNEIRYANIKSIDIDKHDNNFVAINPEYIQHADKKGWLNKLLKQKFNILFIDELTFFKNSNSTRFRTLRKYAKYFKYRVGATGTPTSNGLIDLWSQFYIIDDGQTLGRLKTEYKTQYFYEHPAGFGWLPFKHSEEAIFKRIKESGLVFAPSTDVVSKELKEPKLITAVNMIPFDDEFKSISVKLMKDLVAGEIVVANRGVLMNKLRQICNGFYYNEDEETTYINKCELHELPKNKALTSLLQKTKIKTLLPVYWKEDFIQIKQTLDRTNLRCIYLNTNKEKKQLEKIVNMWNNDELDVLVFNPRTLGFGTNMQKTVGQIIWYSLPYSFELFKQTNCRLARNGYPEDTVMCHILCTEDSIEEEIYKKIICKQKTHVKLFEILDEFVRINTRNETSKKQINLI